MEKFQALRSSFLLLESQDIDTDQIIPARFLNKTDKIGLSQCLFYDWRYRGDPPIPTDHELNHNGSKDFRILVAGRNFGCGSSREHAVWALQDYGFRAVLSPSIGSIFKSNALKNGLLPIEITDDFLELLTVRRAGELFLDLSEQRLELLGGPTLHFAIAPFARYCLLEGFDQMSYLVAKNAKVESYERRMCP